MFLFLFCVVCFCFSERRLRKFTARILSGSGVAMGHNPTVDDGEDPGPPKTDPTRDVFRRMVRIPSPLALPARRSSASARSSLAAIPRSVLARAMGSGFSTDAMAVQAILDARPHLFVHLVRQAPSHDSFSFPLTTKLVVRLSGANYLPAN